MPDELQLRIVDAFAEQPFAGNPAGVILDADGLSERQMQTIANEVNASETAFISGANDLHRPPAIRWFTPAVEVGFCGHATLAAAHALAESVRFRADSAEPGRGVQFESTAGTLRLTRETLADRPGAAIWWLDMPEPGLRADNTNPMKTCELLGMCADDLDPAAPIQRSRDDDLLLFVKSWQRLQTLAPDFHKLGAWCDKHGIRGVCVSTRETLTPFVHVASRFFAPAAGIPEDPVTGSVHGPLALALVVGGFVPTTDQRAALNCAQGKPGGRQGLVRALVERSGNSNRVRIGGFCHTVARGEIRRPPG